MASVDSSPTLGIWSGPIEDLRDEDQRPHFESVAELRPRIEIDEALNKDWFEIWYQPKINLNRKCLAGAEALARIRHPVLGVMRPGSFLPAITEDSVARLTELAVLAALADWAVFDQAGFNLTLAINVPVSVLRKVSIPALLDRYRPSCDHWPGMILELTEDEIVRDPDLARAIANDVRLNGLQISIDHFGAGVSSLSSLRELPFSELKLDPAMTRDCATDTANAALCQTAIDLAHRFGSAAVADGIERQADLQALIAMGCDFGQGPLLAPAMPQEDFLELLLRRISRARRPAAAYDDQRNSAVA
jgi:EAL domain-containing protein (putative c-di-GMP-specific phosphodiesterase class I)